LTIVVKFIKIGKLKLHINQMVQEQPLVVQKGTNDDHTCRLSRNCESESPEYGICKV